MFCQCMVIVTDSMQVTMETSRMRETVPGAPSDFSSATGLSNCAGVTWGRDCYLMHKINAMNNIWTIPPGEKAATQTLALADVWVSYTCTYTLAKERPPSTFG